jgi:hypothetical protein
MNKKANRRAFFVCMLICMMYVSVIMHLPEKIRFQRVAVDQKIVPANMNMNMQGNARQAVPETLSISTAQAAQPVQAEKACADKNVAQPGPGNDFIEPSLFMSPLLVCYAIKEGLIEKEGMIPAGKDDRNAVRWKKPIDILCDKDVEGLKNISKTIGVKHMMIFLKQEGVILKEGLSAEAIMLGRGYVLEKKKLLSLYNRVVCNECKHLFPFAVNGTVIVCHNGNFEFTAMKDKARSQHTADNEGWLMPNMMGLPIKIALDKLTIHTAKIKIHGSGLVVEQSPKPFERISGEAECIIYGKVQKQQNGER